jgi:hypothetical protein
MIQPPKLPRGHPNRAIECEWALREDNFALLERGLGVARADFEAFARKAQAAGWCPEEVAEAMISLSSRYVEARSSVPPASGEARASAPSEE